MSQASPVSGFPGNLAEIDDNKNWSNYQTSIMHRAYPGAPDNNLINQTENIHRAYPGALAYKMSKAAMDQLTRCSALEVLLS